MTVLATLTHDAGAAVRLVDVGRSVSVRNRYLGTWSHGFEVAALLDDGYLIRRASDGTVFEEVFGFGDVSEVLVP